jgi:hypothetical protein
VAKNISTHRFHIGVATRLSEAGFDNDYIWRFGCWATIGTVDVYACKFKGSFASGHAVLCSDTPGGPCHPAAPLRFRSPVPGRPGEPPPAPPRRHAAAAARRVACAARSPERRARSHCVAHAPCPARAGVPQQLLARDGCS